MRVNARVSTVLVLAVVLSSLAVGAAPAGATAPAASCQPYAARVCLFPYPDNRFTRPDRHSATGRRIAMPAAAMPANTHGARIASAPYDRNDGFSPGSAIVLHVPGLDSAAALNRTGAVALGDLARTYAPHQAILLLDETTGRRQLIWAELDANAPSAATRDLIIHPARNLTEGHTYIVVLRNLRTAHGRAIASPGWFDRLRSGARLPATERAQRGRYAHIFAVLRRARIALPGSTRPGTSPSARPPASPGACWPSATPPSPSSATGTCPTSRWRVAPRPSRSRARARWTRPTASA